MQQCLVYPYTQTVEAVEQINPEGYHYRIRCGDMDIVKVAKLQIDLLRLFNALSAVIRRTFICSATRAPWPPPPTRRYRGKVTFSPILPIFQTFFSPNLIWLVSLVNLPAFLLTLPVNLLLFWDWIACELITLFLYSYMWLLLLALIMTTG